MKTSVIVSSITLVIMMLLLSTSYFPLRLNQAQGQISLPECPIGYVRSPSGICEPTSLTNFQNCPVGYQVNVNGFCVPATGSQVVNPANQLAAGATFAQPQSSELTSSLVSPTLINPPAGQLSPWFPSLPAIACGGMSTMTTIGSLERDSDDDNGDDDNGKNNNNKNNDDNDDDKKEYAFQIESDGGQSADPESVDGTVFAGEKNIERNNGKDFDIKDVFNDCQVGMFSK
jgi:hypothetical protein